MSRFHATNAFPSGTDRAWGEVAAMNRYGPTSGQKI